MFKVFIGAFGQSKDEGNLSKGHSDLKGCTI